MGDLIWGLLSWPLNQIKTYFLSLFESTTDWISDKVNYLYDDFRRVGYREEDHDLKAIEIKILPISDCDTYDHGAIVGYAIQIHDGVDKDSERPDCAIDIFENFETDNITPTEPVSIALHDSTHNNRLKLNTEAIGLGRTESPKPEHAHNLDILHITNVVSHLTDHIGNSMFSPSNGLCHVKNCGAENFEPGCVGSILHKPSEHRSRLTCFNAKFWLGIPLGLWPQYLPLSFIRGSVFGPEPKANFQQCLGIHIGSSRYSTDLATTLEYTSVQIFDSPIELGATESIEPIEPTCTSVTSLALNFPCSTGFENFDQVNDDGNYDDVTMRVCTHDYVNFQGEYVEFNYGQIVYLLYYSYVEYPTKGFEMVLSSLDENDILQTYAFFLELDT